MAISESAGAVTVSCSLPVDVVPVGGGVVAGAKGVHAWQQVHRWSLELWLHPPGALLVYQRVYTVGRALHDPAMKGNQTKSKWGVLEPKLK